MRNKHSRRMSPAAKPPYYEDAAVQADQQAPYNLVFITSNSKLSYKRDLFHGSPSNMPVSGSFELLYREMRFTLQLPDDVQLQLLVDHKPVSFSPRERYSGIITKRAFASERIQIEPGDPRMLFTLTDSERSLRRTLFEFYLARYNRVDNGILERFVLGRRKVIRRIKLVPEIYGICRFYGSQIALDGVFQTDILSGRLDKIIGNAVFEARRIGVDESVDAYEQFIVAPWSPDPRVKLVSGRLREARTQTYDLLDSGMCIVEM